MQQARQALLDGLAYLKSGDRFNVIDFDSDFRALFEQSQAATAANLARARTMINALVADGGTEMKGALQFALNQPEHEAYLRQIVFITDGAIGNETELFNLIDSKLHERRLFTIGIGSAPNSYFMSKAAKHGRGSYTYIRNLHQVQQKMAELFSKISKPQMRNIDLDWQQKVEQFPARIPDLYAGEPISVLVKSAKPITRVTASGELLGQAWQQAVQHQAQTDSANLDTVWARAKVGELMDQLALGELETDVAKQQISALGVAHSIVTKFTSLVAVEEAPSKPIDKQSKHNNVPNLMPSGSTMPIPQTATPATLLSLLGASLMVLSMLLRRRQTYRIAKRGLAV